MRINLLFALFLILGSSCSYSQQPPSSNSSSKSSIENSDWQRIKNILNKVLTFRDIQALSESDVSKHAWSCFDEIKRIEWGNNKQEVISFLQLFIKQIYQNRSYFEFTKYLIEARNSGTFIHLVNHHPISYRTQALDALFYLDADEGCTVLLEIWPNLLKNAPEYDLSRFSILGLLSKNFYKDHCVHEEIKEILAKNRNQLKENEIETANKILFKYKFTQIDNETDAWNYLWEHSVDRHTEYLTTMTNSGIWSKNIALLTSQFNNPDITALIDIIKSSESADKQYIFLYNAICILRIKKHRNQKVEIREIQTIEHQLQKLYSEHQQLINRSHKFKKDFLQHIYNKYKAEE